MGSWEELDTEISVIVDNSELDNMVESLNDEDGVFEPLYDIVENLKSGIEEGSKKGVADLARRNKSFQEQYITKRCKHQTGRLQSSIQEEEIEGGFGYIVGTIIDEIYPMSVEYGADIYPVNGQALRFPAPADWDGPTDEDGFVYLKEAHQEPRPFVAPAYVDTNSIAEEIMLIYVENAKKGI